jgi:hypothetical protein
MPLLRLCLEIAAKNGVSRSFVEGVQIRMKFNSLSDQTCMQASLELFFQMCFHVPIPARGI